MNVCMHACMCVYIYDLYYMQIHIFIYCTHTHCWTASSSVWGSGLACSSKHHFSLAPGETSARSQHTRTPSQSKVPAKSANLEATPTIPGCSIPHPRCACRESYYMARAQHRVAPPPHKACHKVLEEHAPLDLPDAEPPCKGSEASQQARHGAFEACSAAAPWQTTHRLLYTTKSMCQCCVTALYAWDGPPWLSKPGPDRTWQIHLQAITPTPFSEQKNTCRRLRQLSLFSRGSMVVLPLTAYNVQPCFTVRRGCPRHLCSCMACSTRTDPSEARDRRPLSQRLLTARSHDESVPLLSY